MASSAAVNCATLAPTAYAALLTAEHLTTQYFLLFLFGGAPRRIMGLCVGGAPRQRGWEAWPAPSNAPSPQLSKLKLCDLGRSPSNTTTGSAARAARERWSSTSTRCARGRAIPCVAPLRPSLSRPQRPSVPLHGRAARPHAVQGGSAEHQRLGWRGACALGSTCVAVRWRHPTQRHTPVPARRTSTQRGAQQPSDNVGHERFRCPKTSTLRASSRPEESEEGQVYRSISYRQYI